MKKRVLSAFMALALCLTLLPAAAWAEEDTPEGGAIVEEQEEVPAAEPPAISEQTAGNGIAVQDGEDSTAENAVAEVTSGDTTQKYDTLSDAIKAAKDGGTVKLLKNVTTESQILVESGTSFTLDLNGQELSRNTGNTLQVSGGSVTVTSSEGTGTISNSVNNAIYVADGATVHVKEGVKLSRLYAVKGATLTLDAGVIITGTLSTNADNIATFLTGKALQEYDANTNTKKDTYVSIYKNYNTNTDESTGCVIVIEHKSCDGTPSKQNPCKICGYDGTQTKPTEPAEKPDVAEVNGTKYKTLQEAIAAANGAEITLLEIFGENVVVSEESSKASIILGTGGTIEDDGKECTYPSYWIAASRGIPLTMNAGEITLKSGVLAQFATGANNNIAIKLNGGTLTVADTVTKIIGGSASEQTDNTAQMAAIEATGGTLDLRGNTHLDGGLSISGDAQLKTKLTAGIFTNSGSSTASVSVEGDKYNTVFDLLAEGYVFAEYNADGTTGDVIAKNTTTQELMQDVTVIKCTHKGANNKSLFKDDTCAGCGFVCEHENVDAETGQCSACGTQMPAKVDGSFYSTLAAAIEAAKDNGTVTLLADVEENITITGDTTVTVDLNGKTWEGMGTTWNNCRPVPLTVNGGSVTLKNGTLNQGGASDNANTAVIINGGSLIVGEGMTIRGANYDSGNYYPAIEVKGGELTLSVGANLIYGMSVPEGKTLADYLPENAAFRQGGHVITGEGEYFDSANAKIINGHVQELTGDFMLTVAEHPTHDLKLDSNGKYTCACGFTCTAHHFDNGKCTVCGYVCPHPSDKVSEAENGTYTCSDCNTQLVVKVEKDGKSTYYAARRSSSNDETLWWLFNNALESGSTVTLLADNLCAWAFVSQGKQITLDLNGKTLEETSQGITVGRDNHTDTTSTNNKLTVKGTLGTGETAKDSCYAFRTWEGGELNLKEVADGGKIGSIIADGGKVTTEDSTSDMKIGTLYIINGDTDISFRAGSFGKICFSGSDGGVTLGNLLAENSGCAFQNADGEFVSYNTVIDGSHAVENVTITDCPHDSITSGTCDYCNLDNLAAALIAADGTVTNYRFTDESDAGTQILLALQAMQTSDNGKVKLFADCEYADKITWEDNKQGTIDLNGHNVTYTGTMNRNGGLLILNSGTLTITDSSTDKTGSFAYVMVKSGASLIADGAYVKQIFANESNSNVLLKAGSKFEGINLGNSRLFNCLDEGCCISGRDRMTATIYAGTTPLTVMQIPGTVTPPTDKNVSISYGSSVPDSFLPTVTLDDGVEASLTYEWLYRDPISYSSPSDAPVTAVGQPLDMICVITANKWSGRNTWETAVAGYKLTVGAANLADATVTATNADSLAFMPDSNGDGQTQTLEFTVTYPDQYTTLTPGTDYEIMNNSNTAADAGEHTLTLQGKGNYAGTLEYKWTVKQRELKDIADLSKPYDGTTALPNITFAYDGGTVKLTENEDYTVTGSFDSADAGERTVTATVTLKNKNYTFADGKTEQTFTVNTQITKAAVSDLKEVSQTIRCVVGVEQSFMPDLTSFGIPAEAHVQDIRSVKCSDGAPVGNYGSRAPGEIYFTLNDAAKVGDTFFISFTIELTNYQDASMTVIVTLIDRDTPTVSANDITVTYDGSAVSADKITGSATFNGKTVEGTWSWAENQSLTNVSDSGEKTVVFTPKDEVNYKPVEAKVQLTVNPTALTNVSVAQSGELTYNGAEQTAAVKTTATAVNGQTVTFTFCDTPSGTYSESVPAFTDAGEHTVYFKASAPNHEDFFGSFKVTVAKADPVCTAPTNVTAIYGQKLSEIALTNPSGNTNGTWTWTDDTQGVGNVGSNTFTAEFTPDDQRNYNSKDNVAVTVTVGKAGSTISAAPTANTLTYNGGEQALVNAGATADGTMVYSLSENGTYSAVIPTGTNADTYTVWYKVKGDSNHNDSTPASVEVTIAKAQVTVTAKDKSVYVGSTEPDLSKPELDKDYTVSGLIGEDKLTTAPKLTYDPATPDMTKTGEAAAIKASDANAGDNYDITYVVGKLTVTSRPSSGGSSSSSTKTETTTNPDGSVTKTETKSDGTVIETTTNKDGSTTKTETNPDGSFKTEVKDASGSIGTVKTDKDGQTTAEAKISDKAVSDAKKSDESVKVPAEVKAGEDSASAPTVKIDLPTNAGETKIDIPVKDVTGGTVAVIVKADGTEEVVKDSIPTEDGIQLTVSGDVTVKIVDNAKNFTDTKGHWAKESIDFVSARGLVNGTGESTFSPNAPTTRAQLWTILARQAGADLTGGANWYEKAQAWAKASGISDGTDPNGTITRAQMVTMLWRAAGSPEVNGASTFTDASADSYYAKAVAWAVQHGITTGVGNGRFDPNGTCTRAQIATFLHRSYLSK